MGWSIVEQPNGKFCIFSSITDSFLYHNLEKSQVQEIYIEREIEQVKRIVEQSISTRPFESFVEIAKIRMDKEELKQVLSEVGWTDAEN